MPHKRVGKRFLLEACQYFRNQLPWTRNLFRSYGTPTGTFAALETFQKILMTSFLDIREEVFRRGAVVRPGHVSSYLVLTILNDRKASFCCF
jgi:hypothetical protein